MTKEDNIRFEERINECRSDLFPSDSFSLKTGFAQYLLRERSIGREKYETTSRSFPSIVTVFDGSSNNPSSLLYSGSIRGALQRILPNDFFFSEIKGEHEWQLFRQKFEALLPIVTWSEWNSETSNLSVFLLCRYRQNVGKFFYDMVSRWLLPGKHLNVSLFFTTNFQLPEINEELHTISEIVLCLDQEQDLEMIRHSLPIIEAEIRLGVVSYYHANRILEIKGLSADEKTSIIQERIAALVQRRPQDFDYDIFGQMQHFLVLCRPEFKAMRESQQMSRIIYIFYLFRKALRKKVEFFPHKRHLSLKLTISRVHLPLGQKRVLSIFVGMNFLKENEIFEQRHLIKAIQSFIPNALIIEDSYFVNESLDDKIQTVYIELEKEDGRDFSLEEIKKLREELPEDLKGRVEQLTRPIFMPRNEEEVMRNIVTLSQQLKYIRDIPQVIISFDEHTDTELSFTIILLRVLHPGTLPIKEIFHLCNPSLKFIPDRVKQVGMIRNKYPKEATVFRIRLAASLFLREDHSVDLYKARQGVIDELQLVLGDVRDFNGGMISKQNEVFLKLKQMLGNLGKQQEFILENFFHSIFPIEMRSVLNPHLIKTLFLMFVHLIEKEPHEKKRFEYVERKEEVVYLMLAIQEYSVKQKILEMIDHLHLPSNQLVSTHLQIFDTTYLGYISFSDEKNGGSFLSSIKAQLDVLSKS